MDLNNTGNCEEGTVVAASQASTSNSATGGFMDILRPKRRVDVSGRDEDDGGDSDASARSVESRMSYASVASSSSLFSAQGRRKRGGNNPEGGVDAEDPRPKKSRSDAASVPSAAALTTAPHQVKKRARKLPSPEDIRVELVGRPTAEIGEEILRWLGEVDHVADTSGNLKGTFVRKLRLAARSVRVAAVELAQRTQMDCDLRQLQEQNSRLQAEVNILRREIDSLRATVASYGGAATSFTPPVGGTTGSTEEAHHATLRGLSEPCSTDDLIIKIGRMVDAKLDGLRSELLHPGVRVRPALTHEAGRMNGVQSHSADPPVAAEATGVSAIQGQETWAVVVGRKAKAAANKSAKQAASAAVTPPPQALKSEKGKKGGAKTLRSVPKKAGPTKTTPLKRSRAQEKTSPVKVARCPRKTNKAGKVEKGEVGVVGAGRLPRPPRTAAVAIMIPPDCGVTYAQALAVAKEKIDLEGLGIQGVKPKRAITGGLLLEVPGENSVGRAGALAAKMGEVLSPMGVRVSRPVKRAELRVTDLDESVTPSEVGAALAATAGCTPADIQVGEVRRSSSRLGSVWVRCPLGAARVLTAAGRVRIGWSLGRVTALAQRPLQCFRCLETGHVRAKCPGVADRSGRCYYCGEMGHLARECRAAAPKCPVCADLGRPHSHRLGGRGCNPPKTKKMAVAAAAAEVTARTPPAKGGREAVPAPVRGAAVVAGQEGAMEVGN